MAQYFNIKLEWIWGLSVFLTGLLLLLNTVVLYIYPGRRTVVKRHPNKQTKTKLAKTLWTLWIGSCFQASVIDSFSHYKTSALCSLSVYNLFTIWI